MLPNCCQHGLARQRRLRHAERQHSAGKAQRGRPQRVASQERLQTIHSGIPGLTHRPSKGAGGRRQAAGNTEQG